MREIGESSATATGTSALAEANVAGDVCSPVLIVLVVASEELIDVYCVCDV